MYHLKKSCYRRKYVKKMDPPQKLWKQEVALAGNRTPVSRVAGENSTTEPPMLDKLENYHCRIIDKVMR